MRAETTGTPLINGSETVTLRVGLGENSNGIDTVHLGENSNGIDTLNLGESSQLLLTYKVANFL